MAVNRSSDNFAHVEWLLDPHALVAITAAGGFAATSKPSLPELT
jgi:hypothetical protein